MQYIQLQPQNGAEIPAAPDGSVNFYLDSTDNLIKLKGESDTITSSSPYITGGTYSNGTITLRDNVGGSINITGVTSDGGVTTTLTNLELTNDSTSINFFIGEPVSFTKTNYGNEVDQIDTDISITRGENQGIYNPELEPGWDDNYNDPGIRQSPKNTLWNTEGWGDLTNLNARTYVTFYDSLNGNLGNNVLSPQFIMKDVVNDKYYKIDFTVWGNAGSGAPVSYTRQQVDGVSGDNIGGLVTFTKPGYADPFLVKDDIDSGLSISRGSNQGIFNTELEAGWNDNLPVNGYLSPKGTKWNTDGWSDLTNIKTRTYKNWVEAFDWNVGQYILNTECIMYDTINDKYYAVKFTNWTGNNNGGGFSYIRQQLNPDVMFVHTTDGSEVDDISEGIGITRDSNNGIYNPYDEGSWDENVSPGGTLWNFDGWENLSNVEERHYTNFFAAQGYWGIGNKIDGAEAIMKVPSTGDYYRIKFTNWQRGGGGAFSYIRTLIDLSKINEGIKFADGTVQKTSANNRIKFKAPFQRRIEEWYGYKEVLITTANNYTKNSTSRFTRNNSNNISFFVDSEYEALEFNQPSVRNIFVSINSGATWTSVRSGGYGSYGGWYVTLYAQDGVNVFTITENDPVVVRYTRGGDPQIWFNPDDSPGGFGNFRGAVIDYHAYSDNNGTVIGNIIVSNDGGDFNVTHSESSSGGSDLSNLILWDSYKNPNDAREGQLTAWRTDGDEDNIKIQWKATMFYGQEFYD